MDGADAPMTLLAENVDPWLRDGKANLDVLTWNTPHRLQVAAFTLLLGGRHRFYVNLYL